MHSNTNLSAVLSFAKTFLCFLLVVFMGLHTPPAAAQAPPLTTDPFVALQQAAQSQAVVQSSFAPVNIEPQSPVWKKEVKGAPIAFQSFPMVDKNGQPIAPNTMVTLKNGKQVTAAAFFAQLNDMEQKLNAQGLTLRGTDRLIASRTVTKSEDLTLKVSKLPPSIGTLRSGATLQSYLSTTKQVGGVMLKPYGLYTLAEKAAVNNFTFSSNNNVLTAQQNPPTNTAIFNNNAAVFNNSNTISNPNTTNSTTNSTVNVNPAIQAKTLFSTSRSCSKT